MKKKKITVFLYLIGIIGISHAQNFEPGSQAQGYLKDKNAMVDHYTGTFHYKVPLFEIKSGNFILPVSLSYSGDMSLLKRPDSPTSKWWHLQTGGIVTRVVRGGVPDETPDIGHLYTPQAEKLANEEIVKVNAHERDGEADIFTVVFNGRSVNFIIEKFRDSIVTQPLEMTNVRIECTCKNSTIDTWSITDENGIVYLYAVHENTRELSHEAEVSTHGVKNLSYISSWYLSSITIPGSPAITFSYIKNKSVSGTGTSYKKSSFKSSTSHVTSYKYRNPMKEFRFDFDVNKEYFDDCLKQASREANQIYMNMSSADKRLYGVNEFSTRYYGIQDELDGIIHTLNTLQTIMGASANYTGVNFPTVSVMNMLNSMILYYGPGSRVGTPLAEAKNYITQSFVWVPIDSNRTRLSGSYTIESPLLEKISTIDQSVLFRYNGSLREIVLQDYKDEQVQKVSLDYNESPNTPVTSVSWQDKNNLTYKNLSFDYHQAGGLLKLIRFPGGGKIEIGYKGGFLDHIYSYDRGINGQRYTINYRYPKPVQKLYTQISSKDTIRYPNCAPDYITRSTPIRKGVVYVQGGNSGLCHDYVEEELAGRGYTTYYFSVPKPSGSNPDNTYSFWNGGLLLAKAMYDKDKKLVYLQRNIYATDMNKLNTRSKFGFEAGPASFNYTRGCWQVQPSEYYLDAQSIAVHYSRQSKILLYQDEEGRHYLDPMDAFEYNIRPRSGYYNFKQCYKFVYGGKTVLARQKEYRVVGDTRTGIRETDTWGAIPSTAYLVSDTEFRYDNPGNSSRPTRVIRYLANGDREITVTRTVADVNLPDTVFRNMREINLLSPVVKEQRLLQKAGSSSCQLIREKVVRYREMVSKYSSRVFLPDRQYEYCFPSFPVVSAIPEDLDTRLFTGDSVGYRKSFLSYKFFNGAWLAVEHRAQSGTEVMLYDEGRNNLIFHASHVGYGLVDAIDKYRALFSGEKVYGNLVNGKALPDSLVVKIGDGTRTHDAYFLVKPITETLSVTCTTRTGTSVPKSFARVVNTATRIWQVVKVTINTEDYTGSGSLTVKFPEGEIAMGVLVPSGTLFEASSFLPSGLLFGKFNQNGQLVINQYDSEGRLVKTFDQAGNLLQEINHES